MTEITLRIDGRDASPPAGFGVALEADIEHGTAIYLTRKIDRDELGGGYFSRRYSFPLGAGERLDVYRGPVLIASFVEHRGRAIDPILALSEQGERPPR